MNKYRFERVAKSEGDSDSYISDTPFLLKRQLPDVSDKIRFVIPIMLDEVSVKLGTWSGYYVLAQKQIRVKLIDNLKWS